MEDRSLTDEQKRRLEQNDYNLKLLRYVDTFEGEEPVGPAVVLAELKAIDGEMAGIGAKIGGCCKDLRIEAPL